MTIPATPGRAVATMLLLALAGLAEAQSADAIAGLWLTGDGEGLVTIRVVDDALSGTIAGSTNDDDDRRFDDQNPDPDLRGRELLGLELFDGFRFDGRDRWRDGTIYDPNSGKTYRCVITIVDETTIRVRGYIGISAFGRTETWKRRN
jgi:uncharacterized protein (DUF2147 family)